MCIYNGNLTQNQINSLINTYKSIQNLTQEQIDKLLTKVNYCH